jgi:Flp pilus assembly protein TadB
VNDMDERDGLGFRFWLKLGGLIILGGLVALVVFLIIGAALLTWGVIGGVIVFGALLIGAAWLFDRREARTRREWEEVGS